MQFREFKKTLAENGIKMHFSLGRIELEGKHTPHELPDELYEYAEEYEDVSDTVNESALEYYREMIAQNPEFEASLIHEWSKEDTRAGRDVKYAIEERIAIQEAEGLQADERTAILSNIL